MMAPIFCILIISIILYLMLSVSSSAVSSCVKVRDVQAVRFAGPSWSVISRSGLEKICLARGWMVDMSSVRVIL